MGRERLVVYHENGAIQLGFGDAIPHLVVPFADFAVEIEFASTKAMATFRSGVLSALEDAEKYMHLRVQMEFIERQKGGESE